MPTDKPRFYVGSREPGLVSGFAVWERHDGRADTMLSRTFASFAEAANYREKLLSGHVGAEPDDPQYRTNEGLS